MVYPNTYFLFIFNIFTKTKTFQTYGYMTIWELIYINCWVYNEVYDVYTPAYFRFINQIELQCNAIFHLDISYPAIFKNMNKCMKL